MAVRWLVSAWVLAAGLVSAQPPVVAPPPAGAAAAPSAVVPLVPQKPHEWPRVVGEKSIGHYIEQMGSPDPTARWEAIRTLTYFGPVAARQASKQLLEAVGDTDPGVRVNAILTLAAVGFDNRNDLPRAAQALRQAIKQTAPGSVIRLYAARCLGAMGPDAHDALDALLILTKDPAWETRDAAAEALGRVGTAVYDATPVPAGATPQPKRPVSAAARTRLLDLLKDPSKAVRLEAIQSLLLLGPPPPRDPDLYEKEAQPFIDEMVKRLDKGTDKAPGEKDPSVRLWLHTLLLSYDVRQAATAMKELTAAVTAADRTTRVQGLTALTVCGPLSAGALTEVRAALRAAEPDVAKAAVMCLLRMGIEGRKAVGDLQQLAASATDEELKKMATEAARLLSPGAVPAK